MSYEPKVQVVRGVGYEWGRQVWREEGGPVAVLEEAPFAYLVTGVPMPGQRVVARDYGRIYTVAGLDVEDLMVSLENGDSIMPDSLRPYDTEAELRERVVRGVLKDATPTTTLTEMLEQSVVRTIAAMREADNA